MFDTSVTEAMSSYAINQESEIEISSNALPEEHVKMI